MIQKVRIPPPGVSLGSKSHQWRNQNRQATSVGSLPVLSKKIYILARPLVNLLLTILGATWIFPASSRHQQLHQAVPINKTLFLTKSAAAVTLLDLTVQPPQEV